MNERRYVTLIQDWNLHKEGEVFGVLQPGEDPGPGMVDVGRAEQLLADKRAAEGRPDTEPAKARRKAVSHG